jgi:hypothetical protein
VHTGRSWTNLLFALATCAVALTAATIGRHRGGLYVEPHSQDDRVVVATAQIPADGARSIEQSSTQERLKWTPR